MTAPVLGLIVSSAGGASDVRKRLVVPLLEDGWTVAVTLTPTAAQWLVNTDEVGELERATGLPVRWMPRLPGEDRPHPRVDGYAVVPASANTVAKLALGIADNQALTTVNEAIGTLGVPVVVFPRVNAAHARHPSWDGHIAALRRADVHLVYGDDVWPLHEPRSAPDRDLPWQAILDAVRAFIAPATSA
jgi:hypothetical protein